MSDIHAALSSGPRPPQASAVSAALSFGWRGMLKVKHVPEQLLDVTITPVMFVLMFTYLFGGAISGSTGAYLDYILPGILVMSVLFTTVYSGVSLNTDLTKGVVDRFRSLPVHRLAILSAQVLGQVLEQVLGMTIVVVLGLVCGWRPTFGLGGALELVALVLLGLTAFTWFGVLIGMVFRSSDAVQGVGFSLVFPLSFLAGTFVPISGMALVPRVIGEWDPIAALVAAVRHVSQGTDAHGSLMLEHPVIAMIGWCALIIAVCVPLALRRFSRS